MQGTRLLITATTILAFCTASRGAGPGKVKLPLQRWEQLKAIVENDSLPAKPDIAFCPIQRSIVGSFDKGLFSGTLTARFEVLDDRGHLRIPVLDSGASVEDVYVNGNRTSLLRQGRMYTLGVEKPGVYTVKIRFYWGKEQVDFARRVSFRVPEGGVTLLKVRIPEVDIEPNLQRGALIEVNPSNNSTSLTGALDAGGLVDLSWKRKLTHKSSEQVQLQANSNTVFTVGMDMITGLSVFTLTVLKGETDRIDLRLPKGIEVVGVDGDAVLQWYTDSDDGGKLAVLLRYLAEDQVRLAVRFQFPSQEAKATALGMPLVGQGIPVEGALGIQGPAGLNIKISGIKDAEQLNPRDLPPELTQLTQNPLQYGFAYTSPPMVTIVATRHTQVELTSTLIDEMQASTVIIEDGTEITKMKLRVRNHTAQYLSLLLPKGSELTHSLIDGLPIRPATGKNENELLLPLRQSERLGARSGRTHIVQQNETLSDIANFYYSDPNQWEQILAANPVLADEYDLNAGQKLVIPSKQGVKVEESSFVIELAYKNSHKNLGALGSLGSRKFLLPRINGVLPEERKVEVVRAVWHLYFPMALDALGFDANMTQYSHIRYDLFTRLRSFLANAFFARAWAGGKYRNILYQRKDIFIADNASKTGGKIVLADFPLVGRRYRFKRTLLGDETPQISVVYAAGWVATPIRWISFFVAFGLALLLLKKRRKWFTWIIAAFFMTLMLIVAHYFLGVHRRLLWGVDAALITILVKNGWRHFIGTVRRLLWSPWELHNLLTWSNLAFMTGMLFITWFVLLLPLLLSSTVLVSCLIWYMVQRRREVSHV